MKILDKIICRIISQWLILKSIYPGLNIVKQIDLSIYHSQCHILKNMLGKENNTVMILQVELKIIKYLYL